MPWHTHTQMGTREMNSTYTGGVTHQKKREVYQTSTPAICGPTPLGLHIKALLLVSLIPCVFAWALTGSFAIVASVVGVLLAHRLVPPTGGGALGTLALAGYWNIVYLTCFTSPFLILASCWWRPLVVGPPTLAWLVWSRFVSRADLKDGAPWREFSMNEWGYHAFRNFLQLCVHTHPETAARPPDRAIIIGIHPHGVASDYRILVDGMLYEALPGRSLLSLAASVLFCIPLVRELSLWTRCIDASKPIASRALKKGHSLMVIPGGEKEQIDTRSGVEEVYLASRFGFVKLALSHGAALVPSYVFGCVDLYDTYTFAHAPREWLRKKLGICIPVYKGSFGFLPKRVPLDMVVGAPIEPQCATPGKPTDAEVAEAHAAYIRALKALFDEHKASFGFAQRELVVKG